MSPQDVQTIYELLANRVVPRSALEGSAILQLATKFVQHFAPKPAEPAMPATPPTPAS